MPVEPRPVIAHDRDGIAAPDAERAEANGKVAHLVQRLFQVHVFQMPRSFSRIAGRFANTRVLYSSPFGRVSGNALPPAGATAFSFCSSRSPALFERGFLTYDLRRLDLHRLTAQEIPGNTEFGGYAAIVGQNHNSVPPDREFASGALRPLPWPMSRVGPCVTGESRSTRLCATVSEMKEGPCSQARWNFIFQIPVAVTPRQRPA